MRKKDMVKMIRFLLILFIAGSASSLLGQKNYNGPPLFLDVNNIKLDLLKVNGEGQFTTQFSWMLSGNNAAETEIWYQPQDEWHAQLLYQIFNPVAPDDNGFINQLGENRIIPTPYVSNGKNDYSLEVRRYRPPQVSVDGTPQFREYRWAVNPDLKADMKAEWEDIIPFWGIRSHVEVYAFSNPNHADYLIWKASYKFTGETKRPIENPDSSDFFPSQTMRLWWPLSFSFGASKGGEYSARNGFAFEGEDDLDSWFTRKSKLVTGELRDSLKVAYYEDYRSPGISAYANGSTDDIGDPDRISGALRSTQIPGFALLHSAKNTFNATSDDPSQPYSMPHGTIVDDLWGRRDFGLRDTYIGEDSRGRFPLDPVTEGFIPENGSQKGPMRFITIGPYDLTLDATTQTGDSICAVYAVGSGYINRHLADSVGSAWFDTLISDTEKNDIVYSGKDSLFQTMDRAFWAWHRGLDVPDPPPPPDLIVQSDADKVILEWSYPDNDYFLDPDTDTDDWYAWRVYRKVGSAWVNTPGDEPSESQWELIHETTDRNETNLVDLDVVRGVSYYYAVSAVDDGSANTDGLFPGQKLESNRMVNRTQLPAIPFKPGLDESDKVRIVPNPATINAGVLGFPGDENRILFARLPYKCKLQVYTEDGFLVETLEHTGSDQEVWDQRTDSNQYVVSGLYILVVTEAESVSGKSLPDQYEKFVLVR